MRARTIGSRTLAALLSLVLAIGLMPTLAFANVVESNQDETAAAATEPAVEPATTVSDLDAITTVNWSPTDSFMRLAGATRYETMSLIVSEGFNQKGQTIIVATGSDFPDALAATTLAGTENAPIVLTDSKTLAEDAKDQIKRLEPTKIYLIGGEGAISPAVATEIASIAGIEPQRIFGANRYETALEVYKACGSAASSTCILATGETFADALSIAPFAYVKHAPIFLVNPTTGIDAATLEAIQDGSFTRAIIVGGKNAIPEDTEAQLSDLGVFSERLAGENRYETSEKVATFAQLEGLTLANVGIATGTNFPDALAGCALCGSNNSVLLLAADTTAGRSAINNVITSDTAKGIEQGYIFGGENAVSSFTEDRLNGKLAGTLTPGLYYIASELNSSMVLDVASGSLESGANIQLYNSNQTLAQEWNIQPAGTGWNEYTIQSLNSGLFLTEANDGNVTQASKASGSQQVWVPSASGDSLVFTNKATGNVLQIASGSATAKANICAGSFADEPSQKWTAPEAIPIKNGYYTIHSFTNSGISFDVASAAMSDGAAIRMWSDNGTNAQKFLFTRNSDGSYTITGAVSGKALDVENGAAREGAKIRQWRSNGSAAQRWIPRCNSDGSLTFISTQNSSLVLNCGPAKGDGAKLATRSAGETAQEFRLQQATVTYTWQQVMMRKAQSFDSDTSWLILVDCTNNKMCIFKGRQNNWNLYSDHIVSTGRPDSPTVTGVFEVGIRGYSFGHGYTCYYYTQFCGDYLFHSVKYYQGTFDIMDGRLGEHVSDGCVRMPIDEAEWIYDNIPSGTTVYVYY